MPYFLILNGPNLNLLGRRQPEIYGSQILEDINRGLATGLADGESLDARQFNDEGSIIDSIHEAGFDPDCLGIVLNAGAYTHTSYAIADAIAAVERPVVEVHISNVHAREDFRRLSVIAPVCRGTIAGFGADSYRLAIAALRHINEKG